MMLILKKETWILVPRPKNTNIVRSMWMYKHKFNAVGTLKCYKSRLVVNGKYQQPVFASYACKIGFRQSTSDNSLFVFYSSSNLVYLLLYVDDIILTASSTSLLQRIITALSSEFEMSD